MQIAGKLYDVLNVKKFVPDKAPNPRCCSDPSVLCPACAAKALAQAGYTANERRHKVTQEQISSLLSNVKGKRPMPTCNCDDVLPLPRMTFDAPPWVRPQTVTTHPGCGPDVLALPTMNFEQADIGQPTAEVGDNGLEILRPPAMEF